MYLIRPTFLLRKIYKTAIWRLPSDKKIIYLTFDDGPIPEITPWVLDTLKKYNAKATFFVVGDNVMKYPEIYNQIKKEGHTIGNHTFNHVNGWKENNSKYIANTKECNKVAVSKFFRPPYGKLKPSQYSILNTQYSIIMWDVLSGDFDQNISKEKCLKNVLNYTRNGSIVVFHDNIKAKENLYYTLPLFIEHFQKKGFEFFCL